MNITAKINEAGQMEVTYRGETRAFDAYLNKSVTDEKYDQWRASCVFFGRFRSGSKVWPVRVILKASGNVELDGGYSNKGGIASITGWYKADSANISQANGQR